jgi:hypothetical protein
MFCRSVERKRCAHVNKIRGEKRYFAQTSLLHESPLAHAAPGGEQHI